jgi:hypothetical protein
MADIFISYSSKDRERAAKLAGALGECGWTVWWDRKIPTGQTIDETIERELDAARCVIVLWSEDSIRSEWVKNEAAAATERDVLLPAMIDRVKLPLEFRRRQSADLIGWDGDTRHEGFQALRSDIAARISSDKSAGPALAATRPPRRSTTRFPWKLVLTAAVLVVLGLVGYWRWIGKEGQPPPAGSADLADRVAGVYYGDVVSDAKGGSFSGVTLTITKLDRNKVRVASDYERLRAVDIELNRVGNTIQNSGGDSLLLLEMDKNPPRLTVNFHGEAAYGGQLVP